MDSSGCEHFDCSGGVYWPAWLEMTTSYDRTRFAIGGGRYTTYDPLLVYKGFVNIFSKMDGTWDDETPTYDEYEGASSNGGVGYMTERNLHSMSTPQLVAARRRFFITLKRMTMALGPIRFNLTQEALDMGQSKQYLVLMLLGW